MNDYNNRDNFDKPRGKRGFDRRSARRGGGGPRDSGRNQMYDAVCADCGNNCKIPFLPSSGKPVYCSDCFEKRGNGNSRSNRSTNFSERRNFSRQSDRHQSDRPQQNYGKKLDIISIQLDKIIKLLTVDEVKSEKPKKKATKAKAKKKEVKVEDSDKE